MQIPTVRIPPSFYYTRYVNDTKTGQADLLEKVGSYAACLSLIEWSFLGQRVDVEKGWDSAQRSPLEHVTWLGWDITWIANPTLQLTDFSMRVLVTTTMVVFYKICIPSLVVALVANRFSDKAKSHLEVTNNRTPLLRLTPRKPLPITQTRPKFIFNEKRKMTVRKYIDADLEHFPLRVPLLDIQATIDTLWYQGIHDHNLIKHIVGLSSFIYAHPDQIHLCHLATLPSAQTSELFYLWAHFTQKDPKQDQKLIWDKILRNASMSPEEEKSFVDFAKDQTISQIDSFQLIASLYLFFHHYRLEDDDIDTLLKSRPETLSAVLRTFNHTQDDLPSAVHRLVNELDPRALRSVCVTERFVQQLVQNGRDEARQRGEIQHKQLIENLAIQAVATEEDLRSFPITWMRTDDHEIQNEIAVVIKDNEAKSNAFVSALRKGLRSADPALLT